MSNAFSWPTTNQPLPSSPAGKAANIVRSGTQLLAQIAQQRINSYRLFWSDPVNIAASLGTGAGSVLAADAALVAFLGPQLTAAGAPAALIAQATAGVPAGYTATTNADGSVTITVPSPATVTPTLAPKVPVAARN